MDPGGNTQPKGDSMAASVRVALGRAGPSAEDALTGEAGDRMRSVGLRQGAAPT